MANRRAHLVLGLDLGLGLAVAMLAGAIPEAAGQDALGAGNVLDANPLVGSGRGNVVRPSQNYQVRNLLVTGDVPAGREFRESVGYLAPGDFAGTTGQDDTFRFRAGSALSAPNFIRFGQTAQQVRFGSDLADLSYHRADASSLPPSVSQRPGATYGLLPGQIQVDRLIQTNVSTEKVRSSVEPQIVGSGVGRDGQPMLIRASSLRGVTFIPMQQEPQFIGLTEYDMLRLREDQAKGREISQPGSPFRLDFESLSPGAALREPIILSQPAEPAPQTRIRTSEVDEAYRSIVTEIASRYAQVEDEPTAEAEPDAMQQLDEEFGRLRNELEGTEQPDSEESTPAESKEDEGAGRSGLLPLKKGDDDDEPRPPLDAKVDLKKFGIILRHGQRVDQLASEDQGRFNELLRSAEAGLRDGEYFWAERRFLRALRFTPGHPLATAGLGHAQLGAGLYGSASMTLRSLFIHQPEMIDVRYGQALLPNRVQLMRVVDELQARSKAADRQVDDGFLLAYIGHQLEDRALVEAGLQLIQEMAPDDPLLSLLREVWLGAD